MPLIRLALLLIFLTGCQMTEKPNEIIVQGHRGCRGLLPENTVEAFIHATRMGVSTLELDIVLTGDGQVLVSHEPFMSAEICLAPRGNPISEETQTDYNIFRMTADSVRQYDCGTKGNGRFPEQKPIEGAYKPLLSSVVEQVRSTCRDEGIEVPFFNIEIKSNPEWVGHFHPTAKEYVSIFLRQFKYLDMDGLTTIQSFDPQIINALSEEGYALKLVYLSEETQKPHIEKLAELRQKPHGYSVHYKLVTSELLRYCDENDIHLSVWTVNEVSDMEHMLDMGVRNIITDYPDRLLSLAEKKNIAVKRSGFQAR